jgi:hypothetical protein
MPAASICRRPYCAGCGNTAASPGTTIVNKKSRAAGSIALSKAGQVGRSRRRRLIRERRRRRALVPL